MLVGGSNPLEWELGEVLVWVRPKIGCREVGTPLGQHQSQVSPPAGFGMVGAALRRHQLGQVFRGMLG